ncbi:MAG: hypothetical protein JXB45_01020 [Candidatus Krumholzibacteriota bacterium]|nr:hypothetical protein [Candidatus Krumholzibacteriota bacterium]
MTAQIQKIMDRARNIALVREEGGGTSLNPTALYILLYALCFAAFSRILDNHFFNDDFSWIRLARQEMTARNLLTFQVVKFFRPLVNLSFYALEHLAPGNLWLHHMVNFILHYLNCVLVFHLLRRLLREGAVAALGAVLFAVTSIHTGAVFWISARTTLLSTFLLLLALLVLISGEKRKGYPALSVLLYILALLAKETAITGLPLLFLVYLIHPGGRRPARLSKLSLYSWSAVSICYLVIRKIVLGGFIHSHWGLGANMLRNLAGGFLYQLYPWSFTAIFYPDWDYIPAPSHPFLPEILIFPAAALLLWIGYNTGRFRAFLLGLLWSLLALLPASAFRYRFFSTESITQNRYYYLSSVGSVLLLALLLRSLWGHRSRIRKTVTVALVLILCAGYMVRIIHLEGRWARFTYMYYETVEAILEGTSGFSTITTVVIKDPPLAFPYIAHALRLHRPEWKVKGVSGGREDALSLRPCLYISYEGEWPKKMTIEEIQ